MSGRNEQHDTRKNSLLKLLDSGKPYSVIYLGIKGFEEAITHLGANRTDDICEVLARRIRRSVRGGDEAVLADRGQYLIVIRGVYDVGAYRSLQDRIRATVENDILIDGKKVSLGVDFGAASFPEDGRNFDDVVEHARQVMLRSEHSRERIAALKSEAAQILSDDPHGEAALLELNVDTLTGLPNAQYFRQKASAAVAEAAGDYQGMTIVFCDIERFKEYNLKHGYTSGDDLLKYLADLLVQAFPNDLVARINSDRFGILTRENSIVEKIETVHDEIRRFKMSSATELKSGICAIADANGSATTAQDYARLACDSIKGRYDIFWRRFDETLANEVRRRQHIVDNLDAAIEQGWIEVYYQPIIRAMTGEVCALEALCRWNDPEFGTLPPNEFIDVLEDAHLIHKLDLCMVEQVCLEGRSIIDAGKRCVRRSINLSRLDYQLCDIFAAVDEIVTSTNFPKSKIHIEFTESAFTQDVEYFATVVERFRSAGYGVWMDDFGSGYSSLNLLKDYNFDMLKIDVEFLRGLEQSSRTRDIVASVVDMAKKLGIQTLAEGVETEEQYQFLRSIGCEMVQGYLFAKPTPMREIDEKVARGELTIESDATCEYFDRIGQINMLSATPFEFANRRTDTAVLSSIIPLGIVEQHGTEFAVTMANDAFTEIFHGSHIAEVDGASIVFTHQGARLSHELQLLAQKAKETGEEVRIDFSDFSQAFTLRALHIAQTGERDAFLVSIDHYGEHVSEELNRISRFEQAADTDRMVYLPTAQDTAWQTSSEIDLAHTAVLVIDVNGGTEGVAPGLEEMAANSVAVVKAARAAGLPVIFAHDSHVRGVDREMELWGEHGMQGEQSSMPIAEFEICDTDILIPKHYYNSFYETNLEETLKGLGVTTLIVAGMDTNICVLQTLAEAYYKGYKTVVPADATASFLVGTQSGGLDYLSRCYDTRIVATEDVIDYLSQA